MWPSAFLSRRFFFLEDKFIFERFGVKIRIFCAVWMIGFVEYKEIFLFGGNLSLKKDFNILYESDDFGGGAWNKIAAFNKYNA